MSTRSQFMIETAFVESDAWGEATHAARGIWVHMHAIMTKRMCGDTVEDCASWTTSYWRAKTLGLISKADIGTLVESRLARWEGPHLVLFGYDTKGENLFMRKSNGGKVGAIRRWNSAHKDFTPSADSTCFPDIADESSTES